MTPPIDPYSGNVPRHDAHQESDLTALRAKLAECEAERDRLKELERSRSSDHARLDWLEDNPSFRIPALCHDIRFAIDATMKQDAKSP